MANSIRDNPVRLVLANGWTLSIGRDSRPGLWSIIAWPTRLYPNGIVPLSVCHEFARGGIEPRVNLIEEVAEAAREVMALPVAQSLKV